MKRELFGQEISQKSKSEFFSATDLVKAGNKYRVVNDLPIFSLKGFMETKSTKEFIKMLEGKYGKVKINANARNKHTWVHPFLFIDIALAISPTLKIETYEWIYDSLIKYRNTSGDSYKKMAGAIFLNMSNKSQYREKLKEIARRVKLECNVSDWQTANEDQLKLRENIQNNISLISDIVNDIDQVVDVAIKKARG